MRALPPSAVVMMVVGMSLIPFGDTAAKLLSQNGVDMWFVAWSRFALAFVLLSCLARRVLPIKLVMDPRIWLRGALISMTVLSILIAVRTIPLADAYGALFIAPSVSFGLSVWLLGERFDLRRAALVGFGFFGVLLITRPGFGWSPGIGYALLAGCFYGGYLSASRWLSDVADPRDLLLSQLFIGTILLAPVGFLAWPSWTLPVAGLTIWSALASGFGNLLLILAYRRAEANALAPLVYTQLIAAGLFGWGFFGDLPDTVSSVGFAILIISGLGAAVLARR